MVATTIAHADCGLPATTAESATAAVRLMVEVAEHCSAAALLPGQSDELRARVDGYVSYVAEYGERVSDFKVGCGD